VEGGRLAARATPGDARRVASGCLGVFGAPAAPSPSPSPFTIFPSLLLLLLYNIYTAVAFVTCLGFAHLIWVWKCI
jgi:hypothetical protein